MSDDREPTPVPAPGSDEHPTTRSTDAPASGILARNGRLRWIIAGAGVVAVALIAIAAVVLVPWWRDGHAAPVLSTIAAGRAHTCAVTADGTVRCWGDNSYGQLGNNSFEPSSTPVTVDGIGSQVVAVTGSGNHTCALTRGGGVWCWGQNASGELGDGTTDDRTAPVQVSGLESGVRTVSASIDHTCALLSSRAVVCWGQNGSSQLGTGDAIDRTTPKEVKDLPARSTDVSVGNGYTCVVFTGRTVRCWGDNGDGQLGLGDAEQRYAWEPITTLPRTSFVSAGELHTCAVTHDDSVWCWGSDAHGQVTGTVGQARVVQPFEVSDVGASTLVRAGFDRTCALSAAGGVTCWGAPADLSVDDPAPTAVEGLAGVTELSVGTFHACAATPAGVACWGSNSQGQLGDGTNEDRTSPVLVATP